MISGSGRMKLDDEIIEIDAARRDPRRPAGLAQLHARSRGHRGARLRPPPRRRRRGRSAVVDRVGAYGPGGSCWKVRVSPSASSCFSESERRALECMILYWQRRHLALGHGLARLPRTRLGLVPLGDVEDPAALVDVLWTQPGGRRDVAVPRPLRQVRVAGAAGVGEELLGPRAVPLDRLGDRRVVVGVPVGNELDQEEECDQDEQSDPDPRAGGPVRSLLILVAWRGRLPLPERPSRRSACPQ